MTLSIITINYNNHDGLQRTINSVLCQTWKDYEWIIIDGGSTDGSKELIEQYQEHFTYWCSEPDSGVYNAMNKGIAKARGEYMNFMNSGDVFNAPDVLGEVFKTPFCSDVAYGDNYFLKDDQSFLVKAPSTVTLDFFWSNNICHQAMFIRSSVLKTEGYDESYQIYGDWAKWLEICYQGASFHYIPIVVCKFDGNDGLSRRRTEQMQYEYKRFHELIPPQIQEVIERLHRFQQYPLMIQAKDLMEERLLYARCINIGIAATKFLRSSLNFFHL